MSVIEKRKHEYFFNSSNENVNAAEYIFFDIMGR